MRGFWLFAFFLIFSVIAAMVASPLIADRLGRQDDLELVPLIIGLLEIAAIVFVVAMTFRMPFAGLRWSLKMLLAAVVVLPGLLGLIAFLRQTDFSNAFRRPEFVGGWLLAATVLALVVAKAKA